MINFIARRLSQSVLLALIMSLIVFFGMFVVGDPVEMLADQDFTEQDKLDLAIELGLDKPLPQQYEIFLGNILHGDFGVSFVHNRPVLDLILERLPATLEVALLAMSIGLIVGIPIGVYSATHQYSWGDHGLTFLGLIGLATPNFLLALVLLYLANLAFGTSIGGLMEPEFINQPWTWAKAISVLEHLWVPVIVIGTSGTAGMIRRLRANLLDEMQKQYVVTGRAKGLSEIRLLIKYPLRMSLNPFIADIGSLLPQVVSGSVIVSAVMSLPTTGPMLLSALQSQDMYLAGSFLMFLAMLTVIGMFISDLLLAVLDPRIRLEGGVR